MDRGLIDAAPHAINFMVVFDEGEIGCVAGVAQFVQVEDRAYPRPSQSSTKFEPMNPGPPVRGLVTLY